MAETKIMNGKRFAILSLFLVSAIVAYGQRDFKKEIIAVLKEQTLARASWAMGQQPVTITNFTSPRSAGGKHDFYSEGDYWWPDVTNPGGPYVQRDGQTNPDNFVAHRHAMIRLSQVVGALASAYVITGDTKYVTHALAHSKAWFADTATRMNPSLQFAQAITGKVTGRGIGIIDTIHLMEVVQGLRVMENAVTDKTLLTVIRNWFSEYLTWLTTHPYGKEEMAAENNHGTCWVMQVSSFAKFTGNHELLAFCKERYKNTLLPNQMATDGSFPRELKRTKPYGYSLFNLDAMTMVCQILSDAKENLWKYTTSDGKNIGLGIRFMFPYVQDKSKWPYNKDVMYWDDWPVAQPFLVFGAEAFGNKEWFGIWKKGEHSPNVEEVIRNLPVRNPLIWIKL
jgi:hypothetical protein